MSKPQYRHAHQRERKRWVPIIEAGQAYCAEPVCLMDTRLIPPSWAHTQLWHLCHDVDTGQWIGPGHRRCNLAESNRRNNAHRNAGNRGAPKKWETSPCVDCGAECYGQRCRPCSSKYRAGEKVRRRWVLRSVDAVLFDRVCICGTPTAGKDWCSRRCYGRTQYRKQAGIPATAPRHTFTSGKPNKNARLFLA